MKYNKIETFKYTTNKILPSVYDDSLSYSELLAKVISYLNTTITNVDEFKKFLDDFIEKFDTKLQSNVFEFLQVMYDNGDLKIIIDEFMSEKSSEIDDTLEKFRVQLAQTVTKQEANLKAHKTYTDDRLSEKRDKATKIKSSDLDTSADSNKIKQINLSEEVKKMMAGTTPINAEVATGGVTTEKLANDSVSLSKVHKNILTGTILVDEKPINYDTTTKVLDLNSNVNKAIVVWGNSFYVIPNGITVVNGITTSSATKLVFNTVDKTFKFEVYTYATTKDEIVLAVIRAIGSLCVISANFPTTVNGVTPVSNNSITSIKRTNLGEQAMLLPPSLGLLPNLDTVEKTFSIPGDSILVWRDKTKAISQTIDIDLSTALNQTSALKIYYDTLADTFKVINFNKTAGENDILVCVLRAPNTASPNAVPGVSINSEYTINGERTNLGEQAMLLPSGLGLLPNLDTVEQTFSIPGDSILVWRDKHKVISQTIDIDLSTALNQTSALKIYYDTLADTFKVLGFYSPVSKNDVLVCVLRAPNTASPNAVPGVSIDSEYTINGESIYGKSDIVPNKLDSFVKWVAHRGYSQTHPENTLIAYKEAKRLGYSYVETDIYFTSDNVPVLLHDGTIDRTSDGTGNVADLTLSELKTYDFGSWKGTQFTGEKIPTFEEFIILCKKLAMHPYIELKGGVNSTQANILVDIVKQYGMVNECTWVSFSYGRLWEIRALLPNARLGFLGGLTPEHITSTSTLKTGTNEVFVFAYPYTTVTKELVLKAQNRNMEVETGTVNSKSLVDTLVDNGVSGIITDVITFEDILED